MRRVGSLLLVLLVAAGVVPVAMAEAVAAATSNDDFANATPALPGRSYGGTTAGATEEPGEPEGTCTIAASQSSVWYRLDPGQDADVRLTLESATDQGLAVFIGRDVGSLREIACVDDYWEGAPETLSVRLRGATPYFVAVLPFAPGDEGEFLLEVGAFEDAVTPSNDRVENAIPVQSPGAFSGSTEGATRDVTEPDIDCGSAWGESVWFSTVPSSTGVLQVTAHPSSSFVVGVYQRDATGIHVIGCLSSGGGRVPITAGDDLLISVGREVWGTDQAFEVTTVAAVPPPNDRVSGASPLVVPGSTRGTTEFASRDADDRLSMCSSSSGGSVWYSYGAPVDAGLRIEAISSSAEVAVHELVDGVLAPIACASFGPVHVRVEAGRTYLVSVTAPSTDAWSEGPFELISSTFEPPENDDRSRAIALGHPNATVSGDLSHATVARGDPQDCDDEGGTLWYRYTAPSTVDGNGIATVRLSYSGSSVRARVYADGVLATCGGLNSTFATDPGVTYDIAVSAYWNRATTFTLDFSHSPSPLNDDVARAAELPLMTAMSGTLANATTEPREPRCGGSGSSPTVWYRVTAPSDGRIAVEAPDGAVNLALFAGDSLDSLASIRCTPWVQPHGSVTNGANAVSGAVRAGRTYLLQVTRTRLDTFDLTATFVPGDAPANDDFEAATPLSETEPIEGSVAGATVEPREGNHECDWITDSDPSGSVWHTYQPTATGVSRLRLSSTGTLGFTVYEGSGVDALTEKMCREHRAGPFDEVGDLPVIGGRTYYIVVEDRAPTEDITADGRYTLSATALAVPANDAFGAATAFEVGMVPTSLAGDAGFSSVEPDEAHRCVLSSGTVDTGLGATLDFGDASYEHSVWYRTMAPATGRLLLDLAAESDLGIAVYDTTTSERVRVGCIDAPVVERESLGVNVVEGHLYAIAVIAQRDWTSRFDLMASFVETDRPTNDDFADRTDLGAASQQIVSMGGATVEPGEPTSCSGGAASVWYSFTAIEDGLARLTFDANSVLPTVGVYRGDALSSLEFADCEQVVLPLVTDTMVVPVVEGGSYAIALSTLPIDVPSDGVVQFDFLQAPYPPNDDLADAHLLDAGSTVDGDTRGATSEAFDGGDHCQWGSEGTVWYRFVEPTDGVARLRLETDTDMGLAVYEKPGPVNEVACWGEQTDLVGGERLDLPISGGRPYWIAVAGADRRNDADFDLSFDFTPAPWNDDYANAIGLPATSTASTQTVNATLAGATVEADEVACGGTSTASTGSVWYSMRPLWSGSALIELDSTEPDLVVAAYRVPREPGVVFNDFELVDCTAGSPVGRINDVVVRPPGANAVQFVADHAYDYLIAVSGALRPTGGGFTLRSVYSNAATGPRVSVADVQVDETAGHATFAVTLSQPALGTVSVGYSAVPGSATSGADFEPTSGRATFAAGATTATVSVPLSDDAVDEANEEFLLRLSDPSLSIVVEDGIGIATVVDDDAAPVVAVADDVATEEGSDGALFLSLRGATEQAVEVLIESTDGTALAGIDYAPIADTVSFAPGETVKVVPIITAPDGLDEADESFLVRLTSATNATLGDSDAVVTVRDVDPTPVLDVADTVVVEGDDVRGVQIAVSLSGPSSRRVTASYATASGTALGDADYRTTTGTVAFEPGAREAYITVDVIGDTSYEGDETFTLTLSAPNGAVAGDMSGIVTVVNDDRRGKRK